MLKYEHDGTAYVKAEINRQTQALLPKRTHKSIEYRWQSISAVLNNHNRVYTNEFKPANNVGARTKEWIWEIILKLQTK